MEIRMGDVYPFPIPDGTKHQAPREVPRMYSRVFKCFYSIMSTRYYLRGMSISIKRVGRV